MTQIKTCFLWNFPASTYLGWRDFPAYALTRIELGPESALKVNKSAQGVHLYDLNVFKYNFYGNYIMLTQKFKEKL